MLSIDPRSLGKLLLMKKKSEFIFDLADWIIKTYFNDLVESHDLEVSLYHGYTSVSMHNKETGEKKMFVGVPDYMVPHYGEMLMMDEITAKLVMNKYSNTKKIKVIENDFVGFTELFSILHEIGHLVTYTDKLYVISAVQKKLLDIATDSLNLKIITSEKIYRNIAAEKAADKFSINFIEKHIDELNNFIKDYIDENDLLSVEMNI